VPHAPHHFVGLAVEERHDLVDHGTIVGDRLRADARPLAALDVVVEAGPLRHLGRHVPPA